MRACPLDDLSAIRSVLGSTECTWTVRLVHPALARQLRRSAEAPLAYPKDEGPANGAFVFVAIGRSASIVVAIVLRVVTTAVERLEVVLAFPFRDGLAELGALLVGGAKVNAAPDARVDDLVQCVREPVEVPRLCRRAREPNADNVEGDLVGAEELRITLASRCSRNCAPKGDQGSSASLRRRRDRRRIEEGPPSGVGLGRRVAIGVR